MANKNYSVGQIPPDKWHKVTSRLMDVLTTEFKDPMDWTTLPSVMLLFGAGLLTKHGVPREEFDKMVTVYLAAIEAQTKKAAN